ncbi:MAG: hypothetical protein VKN33_05250 [Candidatus Sericytochromatia bacterium]|nr:hypothetical protein [Candidatus Sericytochromatia bacterium]
MEDGFDRKPRSEGIRLIAALCYVPPVAALLLLSRRHRDIRLVRFHAVQSTGVMALTVLGLILGNVLSSVFTLLPSGAFWSNFFVGLLILLLFLLAAALLFYGAFEAYQGNYTRIPFLTNWAWSMLGAPSGARRMKKRRRDGVNFESKNEHSQDLIDGGRL